MAVEIEPVELRNLVDAAERPRAENWSLRAALTRYGQPEPQRASDVTELLRRIEYALKPHTKLLERGGPEIWQAVQGGDEPDGIDPLVVPLLLALAELDRLGDALAEWAVDRADPRPDAEVDGVVADVSSRLDELGVEREADPRGPRGGRGV